MTRTKQRYHNLLKGLIPSNPSLDAEAKVSSLNKNQKAHHKHKMIHIIMKILTIITIMRIIGANPEVADPIEDKIQDIPLEVKILVVEVKEIRIHTKVNIKMTAIKATITRVIKDSIIVHVEISLKVIVMVNQEAEAMAFKGEHNINDIMEKMNINGHQLQSRGLYS